MKIKKVRARNFLSIGGDWLELDFTTKSNIVLIKGLNLDISPQSSNGAGKSTLIEMLVYGFYGKLIKDLSHKEVLNKKTKARLEIELWFEMNDTNYKIVRTRSGKGATSGSLELFNLDKEDPENPGQPLNESLGGMPATQEAIEGIIKLNCEAFVNVVCFGEHNNHAFLSLKAEEKRNIVENLLALEKYVKYCKKAREHLNALEGDLKITLKRYDTLLGQKKGIEERINQLKVKQDQWKNACVVAINGIEIKIKEKQAELNASDEGEAILVYKQAQEKIRVNKDEVVSLEERRVKLSQIIEEEVQPKLEKLSELRMQVSQQIVDQTHKIEKLQVELKSIREQNKKLDTLQDGVKCSHCYGKISKENYATVLNHNNNRISHLEEEIVAEKAKLPTVEAKRTGIDERLVALKENKKTADERLLAVTRKTAALLEEISRLSKLKEPNASTKGIVLNEQLKELEMRLEAKRQELANDDPYEEILASTKEELGKADTEISSCKADISKNEGLIPYYEYWVEGFGDKGGIRSFIIDGILPALNARINYWLQFLIDNKLQLKFDRDFEPKIERNPPDGDPFVYAATSGGERRRINLAISQAFAHVMMLSTNVCPSLISLDEVALNVDLQGIHGIYKMINELSRDRQVLVTTHDTNLLDLLENCDCDIISVVKKGGFTRLNEAA